MSVKSPFGAWDDKELDFWQFVYERQAIWHRRRGGMPRPWTNDVVLHSVKFTNVFRELDAGTQPVFDIMRRDAPAWIRAWNVILYRRFNRVSTWNAIGFSPRPAAINRILRKLPKDGPVFTGAHEVSQLHNRPDLGHTGAIRHVRAMKDQETVQIWTKMISNAATARDAFTITHKIGMPGIGKFLAWQLVLDMRYGLFPIGRYSDNTWAPIQSGSLQGASMLGARGLDKDQMQEWLGDMVSAQDKQFKSRGLDFKKVAANGYKRLTFAAMEHALCEYSKYARVCRGEHIKRSNYELS